MVLKDNIANDGNQTVKGLANGEVKLKVMEDWVVDLTEQNRLLLNEVEGLEKAAAQRLICLERSGSTEQLKLNDELTEKTRRLCQLESEMERLEKTLCDKECQLEATVRKNQSLLNNLNQKTSECAELQKLDARNRLTQMESEVACLRRTLSQKELVLEQYTCQISELRQQVERKECELEEVRSSRCSRLSEMELDLRRLQEVLYEKECQLEKCTQQISELQQCIEARIQVEEELKLRTEEVRELSLESEKLQDAVNSGELEVQDLHRTLAQLQRASRDVQSALTAEVAEKHDAVVALRREAAQLEEQLRQSEMQTHFKDDIIKQLRKEVKLARAKLSKGLGNGVVYCGGRGDCYDDGKLSPVVTVKWSSTSMAKMPSHRTRMKTSKAQRKNEPDSSGTDNEVHESLAEIFGLKECPRIQMKEKIERLNAELEDRQMVIAELEHRLEATRTQELEDRINKLNRQLMSRERDIVALCNKMDYVRRYVKRLRDDEELSVKCGLEALLHELNEDSEWNKETRRSVTSMCSDMADSSVIVINRVPARSLSLPDSSIKKHNEWNLRTWSEPSVMSSQQGVLDFVPDKCEDAAKLRELQRNLDDSSAKLSKMWKDIKLLSLDISNNTIYNDLEEFKDETKLDHETLAQINVEIQNIVNTLDPQSPQNDGVSKEYLLGCLENNLADLMELLARDGLVQTDSTLSFEVAPNCAQLTPQEVSAMIENITIHIGDSVSIIQQIKGSLPCQWMSNEGCGMNKSIEQTLKDMQIILDDVISNRKCAYKKLCNIQKIQSESYCNISQKFAAFDEMYAIHESTAKFMKHEVANIVNRLASNEYERRVKDNVGSKSRSGEDYLGEKVTIKEQEIMKKDRKLSFLNKSLFHKMDSLKPCRSSPLPCQTERPTLEEDALKNFDEKSYQAQQVVNDLRKEIESTMCKLINREEKLALLEKEVATVNRSLYNVQTEIRNIKHYLQSPQYSCLAPKISKLESNLNQAELDVKRLLAKSQSYVRDKEAMEKSRMEAQRAIATLQSDLSNLQIDMSDSLKTIKNMFQRLDAIFPTVIQAEGGVQAPNHVLPEQEAGDDGKQCKLPQALREIERLEEDLMRNPVSGDCCLSQETSLPKSEGVWPSAPSVVMTSTLGETQLQLIEMQEDMKRSLQEAYSSLSSKDMELLNSLQLNEESERLKKDICNLQKDLDSRQKVIDNQQETIALLQDGLGRAKCETDTLSTKLQTLSCEKKNVEMENQRVMQELQAKVCSLQAALQKGNANTVSAPRSEATGGPVVFSSNSGCRPATCCGCGGGDHLAVCGCTLGGSLPGVVLSTPTTPTSVSGIGWPRWSQKQSSHHQHIVTRRVHDI
ncbi:hypothetical protein AAG570_001508 [Ranatra chinensis]|uniref:Uncharacterized protein n=1 Tax=Ranatra chinensis TaxID=642074 RepID=A0ABD0Y8R1_9HEMI